MTDARWRARAEALVREWEELHANTQDIHMSPDECLTDAIATFAAEVAREAEAAAEKFCPEGHSIYAPGPVRDMPCPTCQVAREERERCADRKLIARSFLTVGHQETPCRFGGFRCVLCGEQDVDLTDPDAFVHDEACDGPEFVFAMVAAAIRSDGA